MQGVWLAGWDLLVDFSNGAEALEKYVIEMSFWQENFLFTTTHPVR